MSETFKFNTLGQADVTLKWDGKKANALIEAVARDISEQTADLVASDARGSVARQTGNLSASVTIDRSNADGRINVRAYGDEPGHRYYASFIEYGYHAGGTFVPPQPYFRPALAKGRRFADRMMASEIRRLLK